MSLKIRLARAGTKKRPVYHIVIADSRSPRDGRFIERLGYFNPLLPKDKAERLKLDLEKVKAWMAKGALPTDRVSRFLDEAGMMKREKRNNPEKAKPRKKRRSAAQRKRLREGRGAADSSGMPPRPSPLPRKLIRASEPSRGAVTRTRLHRADRRRARRARRGAAQVVHRRSAGVSRNTAPLETEDGMRRLRDRGGAARRKDMLVARLEGRRGSQRRRAARRMSGSIVRARAIAEARRPTSSTTPIWSGLRAMTARRRRRSAP